MNVKNMLIYGYAIYHEDDAADQYLNCRLKTASMTVKHTFHFTCSICPSQNNNVENSFKVGEKTWQGSENKVTQWKFYDHDG